MDSTIVDQKTSFGKTLKSEQEKNYHFASIEYKQLKEMYKNSSLHNIADHYHYKEMVAKRKINKKTSPSRWLNYFFGDLFFYNFWEEHRKEYNDKKQKYILHSSSGV